MIDTPLTINESLQILNSGWKCSHDKFIKNYPHKNLEDIILWMVN